MAQWSVIVLFTNLVGYTMTNPPLTGPCHQAFLDLESAFCNEAAPKLVCLKCDCAGFQSNGGAGNASARTLRRQLKCKNPICRYQPFLHAALETNGYAEEARQLQAAYEAAKAELEQLEAASQASWSVVEYRNGKRNRSPSSSNPNSASSSPVKPVKLMVRGPTRPPPLLGLTGTSNDMDLSKSDGTDRHLAPSCDLETLLHQVKVQAVEITQLKEALASEQALRAQLQTQINDNAELRRALAACHATMKRMRAGTAPQGEADFPSLQETAQTQGKVPDEGRAGAEGPKRPAKPAEASKTRLSFRDMVAKATDKVGTHKEILNLRRCVAPPKPTPVIAKVHFKWHSGYSKGQPGDRKAQFDKARKVLTIARMRGLVKEISFIGRSVLELYVEASDVPKVKNAMRTFAGVDTFIPSDEITSYGNGVTTGPALTQKIESRLVFLMARNPGKGMRTCMLQGISVARQNALVQAADALRAEWEQGIRPPRKGDNIDQMDSGNITNGHE